MDILVIGSCTGAKDDASCPSASKLMPDDFEDPERLANREARLSEFLRPAAAMYLGRQHSQMMDGVKLLRESFGHEACRVAIVSAGYGLIDENRRIAPYDITFQGMPKPLVKARGEKLGIPDDVRRVVRGKEVVFFLLGDSYLLSARPPLTPAPDQRFIAFGSPKLRSTPGTVVLPAAQREATRFGDGVVTLKGRMFHVIAAALVAHPNSYKALLADDTSRTVLDLMEKGLQLV